MRRRDGSKEGILLELEHTESVEISYPEFCEWFGEIFHHGAITHFSGTFWLAIIGKRNSSFDRHYKEGWELGTVTLGLGNWSSKLHFPAPNRWGERNISPNLAA